MLNIEKIRALMSSPLGTFEILSIVIIVICVASIILSIMINFIEAKKEDPKREKRSIVATGTMSSFFIFYYLIIKFQIGTIRIDDITLRIILILLGLSVMVIGTIVNIKGRLILGKNWANQIKIYKDHEFVRKGVYSIVRHPLYASLIWMFVAGSIIYLNYLSFIVTLLIFIPFMYYRAKQEEEMLKRQFKNYSSYIQEVGMFIPRIIK